jgi:succinoglycan biosynthesis transport protein ExoP
MQINERHIDLQDYLRVILKHRWTIITIAAVILISVTIFSFTATPIYEAKTRIIIEKENPKVVSFQEVMAVDASGMDYYQTQYKLIESRAVAGDVIKRLQLENNTDFNPRPGDTILSAIREAIMAPLYYLGDLMYAKGQKKDQIEDAQTYSPLTTQFIKMIKVSPIRNSRLVDISVEFKDPVMATRMANTLAKSYIALNLETKLKATQDAVSWLNSRIDEERKKVDTAEQTLLRYKEQQGIITDFSSNVETITAQKLAELNKQVVESEAKRVEAETRYRQASNLQNKDVLDSIPEVLSNSLINEIKKQEVELFKRRSELTKKYGRNHPQMIAMQKELDTLNVSKAQEIKRVINSLHNEYKVAQAREQSLKSSLGLQKGESLAMNQKAIDYNVLKRSAESTREMYDLLIKRFKETSLTEDIKTGNIRVVDVAEVPKTPVKPKKALNILLALVVGLSLGIGMAFFLEYLDNTIKIPEDITDVLKIPYLGPVPAMATETAPGAEKKPPEDLVTHLAPKSTASEAYRGIRTGLLLSSVDRTPQVILICSAGPSEGKTITAANIAVTMAQAGGKTLLLDCDMRRPKLHRLFGIERNTGGMSNILVGSVCMDDTIVHTLINNMDIIPSGPIPPNPSELLGSHHMKELIERARTRYERIIIDSPPITAVTDAVILSSFVDGVVVVIRAGDTHRQFIKNGLAQLQAVNARILGAVLNGVEMGRDSYYYYQYYYYYYGEDGERQKKVHRKGKAGNRYEEALETTRDYGSKIKESWMKEQGATTKRIWNSFGKPKS